MASKDVPNRREQCDAAEHGNVPIHSLRIDRCRRREETEDEEREEEPQRNCVDDQAPTPEREGRQR